LRVRNRKKVAWKLVSPIVPDKRKKKLVQHLNGIQPRVRVIV
jgi:hypothetical protein